jgi:catechol 2,3-dioxygenase-like lactoylglutathione lyase family enzyme
MPVPLGKVGHFSLAVKDPERSAKFWTSNFDLKEIFRFEDGIAISNDAVTMALFKGKPDSQVMEHMSFHLQTMRELRAALEELRKNGVRLEDPGDEIGPEASGSPHMGLWFYDPDGYRWELSVQDGAAEGSENGRQA